MAYTIEEIFIIYILPGILFTAAGFFLIWIGRDFFGPMIHLKNRKNIRAAPIEDKNVQKAAFRTTLGIGLSFLGLNLFSDGVGCILYTYVKSTNVFFVEPGISLLIVFIFGLVLYYKIKSEYGNEMK